MVSFRHYTAGALHCLAERWAVPLIALLQFALHLWVGANDSFFRDELYYIAASRHLDFGFVDFPPLVALLAGGARLLLGGSLVALRLLPALAGALIVLLTADMVRRLGGNRLTQVLAAFVAALAPMFMGSSGLMTMDPFDQLWWTLCAWTLLRMIRSQDTRLWLLFGLFAGLGLLTKLTMAFYAAALLLGLLLSNQRRLLLTRWLVFGGLIALALISPYLIWNAVHGFPTLDFMQAYAGGKTYQASPLEFLMNQLAISNPLAVPLWLCGLWLAFFTLRGRPYRAFGWAYVFLYLLFMVQHAKFYWLSGAYPPLLALGAYGLELLVKPAALHVPTAHEGVPPLPEYPARLPWLQPAYAWALAVTGLFLVPFAIPILPPQAFIQLNGALGGIAGQVKQENLPSGVLPQNYADRYGWHEIVDSVQAAFDTLTPQEQADACIYADNYGQAAAVDFYGPAHGLPEVVSGHNSYFQWGPQGCTGQVLITVGVSAPDLAALFESVEPAGVTSCAYCMPHENGAPILIARGMRQPLEDVWPTVKGYR